MKIETKAVHGNSSFDPVTGAVSCPIYQSATFRHPGLYETTGYDYSRLQNPTREELEKTIAILENGKFGFAFSSGMAAVDSVIKLFSPGDHIVVSDDLYGGTYRLFEEIYKKYGFKFSYCNTSSLKDIENAINSDTKAVFIETPSNPTMKVTDIRAVTALAKSENILTIVDNTFLTPYLQRPLELGADIVLHSGTKYLSGHNDTLAGFVIVNDQNLDEKLRLIQKSVGAILAPLDSWLVLRGIKTLAVRMDKQQKNALILAEWLRKHPKIDKVYYTGLKDHEGYEINKGQSSGPGAMISFSVKNEELVKNILGKVKIILFAESLGGVESLITYPMVQTHAAIPKELREKIGVNERLLRLSVGIEAAEDLIEDLENALG